MRDRTRAQAAHRKRAIATWSAGLYATANAPARAQPIMQAIKAADAVSTSIKQAEADHEALRTYVMSASSCIWPVLSHVANPNSIRADGNLFHRSKSSVQFVADMSRALRHERPLRPEDVQVTEDEYGLIHMDGPGIHMVMPRSLYEGLGSHPDIINSVEGGLYE